MPKGTRRITKEKSLQRINLKDLLGRTPTDTEKETFTLSAIEIINQRTLDGKDIDGKKFTPYSKAYAEKKGVPQSAVDLFDTGDMLDDIERDTSSETKNTIAISIDEDFAATKSFAHNTGEGKMPKREFFGVTRNEAEQIASRIKRQATEPESRDRITLGELRAALATLGIEQEE